MTIRPAVIFFDVNGTLLDMKPVRERIAELFGDNQLMARLWFTMTLQHSMVMTASNQFAEFGEIAAACLEMLARNEEVDLTKTAAATTVSKMRKLAPFSEVPAALERLRRAGLALAALTNSSKAELEMQMENAALTGSFDALLSVEDCRVYKPQREVYCWAAQRMGVAVSESLMAAAHGWDVAGAAWAGMRTAFIARPNQQLFPLAPVPELVCDDLLQFAGAVQKMGPRSS